MADETNHVQRLAYKRVDKVDPKHALPAFEFIRSTLNERGYPPSRREVMTAIGVHSPSTAQLVINDLRDRGWIEIHPGIARGMRVTGGPEHLGSK